MRQQWDRRQEVGEGVLILLQQWDWRGELAWINHWLALLYVLDLPLARLWHLASQLLYILFSKPFVNKDGNDRWLCGRAGRVGKQSTSTLVNVHDKNCGHGSLAVRAAADQPAAAGRSREMHENQPRWLRGPLLGHSLPLVKSFSLCVLCLVRTQVKDREALVHCLPLTMEVQGRTSITAFPLRLCS